MTKIAGVDLREEEQLMGLGDENNEESQYSKEAEPVFLNINPLKKKVLATASSAGVKSIPEDVHTLMSLAVQDHLRTILEYLTKVLYIYFSFFLLFSFFFLFIFRPFIINKLSLSFFSSSFLPLF